MLKVIAIDDEPIAIEIISNYMERSNDLEMVAVFHNALEAFSFLNNNKVDLMFLDIRMPDISGIDFYKKLIDRPPVIFTTAYSEFAVEGFELDIVDYLLKPFPYERFRRAVNKARYHIEHSKKENEAHFLSLKSGYDIVRVNSTKIVYVASFGNYIRIFLTDGEVLGNCTLKDILSKLSKDVFIQVHRSYVINKDFVQKIRNNKIYLQSHIVPIGETFQKHVRNMLLME